jgi:hypothetical protein
VEPSLLAPRFLARLADPSIVTVLLAGCGGGFDFVHAAALYPDLVRMGKRVVWVSYSFGDPARIGGEAPVVFERDGAVVKRVTARSIPDGHYGPEVHLAGFLDERFPERAPHGLLACNARRFTVPALRAFYRRLAREQNVDAAVIVDGGSDSLMRGDEEGLGDPIEDAVSVTALADLHEIRERLLVTVGLGCDRFNQVSDAASLRAIAELTAAGGFLGAVALHEGSPAFAFYRDALDHLDARQPFRSVLSGAVISAGEGRFGRDEVPERLQKRVREGELFLWPLMAMLWGFDVRAVAARSLIAGWIREQTTVLGCHAALQDGRFALGAGLRDVEELPRHVEMRARRFE